MAIKATVSAEYGQPRPNFPCLGVFPDTGNVYIFTDSSTGVLVLRRGSGRDIGSTITGLGGDWVPLTGTVTLENK